jgi:hypothetical protein
MTMRGAMAVLALLAGLLAVRPALAHEPVFDIASTVEQPIEVPDAVTQRGYYGALSAPYQVDYFRLTLDGARPVQIWLLVPDSPGCGLFRPQLAVMTPGGPPADVLGLAAPPGYSATPYSVETWGQYLEPDTRLPYLAGPRIVPDLDTGESWVAVFDPSGRTGAYLLLIGDLNLPGTPDDLSARAAEHHRCLA